MESRSFDQYDGYRQTDGNVWAPRNPDAIEKTPDVNSDEIDLEMVEWYQNHLDKLNELTGDDVEKEEWYRQHPDKIAQLVEEYSVSKKATKAPVDRVDPIDLADSISLANSSDKAPVPANATPLKPEDAPWIRNDMLRVVMVDQQKDANVMATEAAHRRLEAEIEADRGNLNIISNFFKNKIWKGSLGRELVIQKYKQEALADIEKNKSILINHELSDEERDKANRTTILRFMSEGDEMIHKMAGEKRQIIDESTEPGKAMKAMIYELLEQKMRQPDLEKGSFDEIVKLKMLEYQQKFGDEALLRRGDFYLDNIAPIADMAREKADHLAIVGQMDRDEAIRQVLAEVQIVTGESRNTARTEMRLTKTEKFIERLSENPGVRRLAIKPEMVAAGAALASGVADFVLKRAGRRALSSAIPLFGGAIASGIAGGAEEAYRQEEARNLQQRQLAQGGDINSLTDIERQRLERFAYGTVAASEIIDDFKACFDNLPDLRSDLSPEDQKLMIDAWVEEQRAKYQGDPDAFNAEMAGILRNEISHIAYTNSRINISDKNRIDLIRYSSPEAIEQERWNIDGYKHRANSYLCKILEARPEIAETLFRVNGITASGDLRQDYQQLLNNIEEVFTEGVENDIDVKDKAFRKFKRNRVFQKVAKETAKGFVIGTMLQEARALVDNQLHGALEGLIKQPTYAAGDKVDNTFLAQVTGLGAEKFRPSYGLELQDLQSLGAPDGVREIKLDGGFKMVADQQSGAFDIVNASGEVAVDDLRFDAQGNFTPESLQLLRDSGFNLSINSDTVADGVDHFTKQVTSEQFIEQNRGDMVRTSIQNWYDNDTVGFDRNELKLDMQLGEDGNIRLSTNRMVSGGSFHNGDVADITGQKIFISASQATQKLNFEFQPDANGVVTITPDSEAYKLFAVNGNEVDFKGGFIQASNALGLNDKGETIIKPLATVVGEDNFTGFVTEENVEKFKQLFDYQISAPEIKIDVDMVLPPFVPIYTRRELPPIKYNKSGGSEPQIGDNDYYYQTPESRNYSSYNQVDDSALSERIEQDRERFYPTAEREALNNDLGRVMQWYDSKIEQHNGKNYADWVQKKVGESGLEQLSPETKAILQIPVYAAGESEANKLGDILQNAYAEQIKQNNQQKEVAIFLNVNWRYQDQADPKKLANIQKTVDAVKQFKAQNPDLQIYSIFNTFTDVQLRASGNAINQITKHNTDILLSALGKNVREGRAAADFNPLLIRNDADAEGLDKSYFANLMAMADRHPESEIFSGVTYFDRKVAERNPVLSLSLEMLQALNIYGKARGNIHTAGANFACRAKSVAETGFGFNARMFGAGSDDMQFGKLIKRKRDIAEADGQTFSDKLGRLVGGARVMTNADRQEQAYTSGKNGIDPWSDEGSFYDANGNYVGRNDASGTNEMPNDVDLLKTMSEIEAKSEIKKRLEHNLSLVLKYNPKDNYEYGTYWLKRYLEIPAAEPSDKYFTINDSKLEFTNEGLDIAYNHLISNNAAFCQFLQDRTDYWNVL